MPAKPYDKERKTSSPFLIITSSIFNLKFNFWNYRCYWHKWWSDFFVNNIFLLSQRMLRICDTTKGVLWTTDDLRTECRLQKNKKAAVRSGGLWSTKAGIK